jgi:hypothetical protein
VSEPGRNLTDVEESMKHLVAVSAMLAVLAACQKPPDRDTGAGFRASSDTTVTKREMHDTTIVRHDTAISADTVRKRGKRAVKTDTIRKP